MGDSLDGATERLLEALAHSERGPKRNAVFALWLVVRLCEGMLVPRGVSERSQRRRQENLERRLSSLSLPPPTRRALAGSLRSLRADGPAAVPTALQQLVAPVRESVGGGAADAVLLAARSARTIARESAAARR